MISAKPREDRTMTINATLCATSEFTIGIPLTSNALWPDKHCHSVVNHHDLHSLDQRPQGRDTRMQMKKETKDSRNESL